MYMFFLLPRKYCPLFEGYSININVYNEFLVQKRVNLFDNLYKIRLLRTCFSLIYSQAVSDAMLVELKQCFMEAYDDNQDGKIDIREVSV
jgi:hypothetical protein